MRRATVLFLPFLLLFLIGCSDQSTNPEIDLTASYGKPEKPPKPPKPGSDPAFPEIAIDGDGLWVADDDGGNKTMIYDPGRFFNPSWFTGGAGTEVDPFRILISAGISGQIPMEIVEVVVDNGVPRAGAITEVLPDPWYVHAEISPNGSEIVAIYVEPDYFHHSVRLVDLSDGTYETLYEATGENEVFRPEWNPEGTKVAFFENVRQFPEETTLWVMDMATRQMKVILTFTAVSDSPRGVSWGRTMDQLVFDYDGTIYHVILDGNLDPIGDPVPLGSGRGAVWSPDDSRIAYEYRNTTYIKTFPPARKDQRILGGWWPDWRR